MRDDATPSCFCISNKTSAGNGDNHDQENNGGSFVGDVNNITASGQQNLVACTYEAKFGSHCRVITVTWSKNVTRQTLQISVGERENQSTCKVDLRPWWAWRSKQGSKRLRVDGTGVLDVFWDLSSAKFSSGAEPKHNYCIAVVYNGEAVLLLGDMNEAALKKTRARAGESDQAVLLSRKEHVFGKNYFAATAQFGESGRSHEVVIECQTKGRDDPVLVISVDKKRVVEVKRLVWKFRGNYTIYVEGSPVQILWDVHDWLFSPGLGGHGMFVFRPAEEKDDKLSAAPVAKSVSSKDGNFSIPPDFCLMLYAWKCD